MRKISKYKKRLSTCSIVDIALIIGLILSIWAIVARYFGFLLIPIGWEESIIKSCNDIFSNLAFSYIAGLIIYFFSVKLPYFNKKKRAQREISIRIYDIGVMFRNMIEYANKNHKIKDDLSNIRTLKVQLERADWENIDDTLNNEYKFRETLLKNAQLYTEKIQACLSVYQEFLTNEQLVVFERILTIDLVQSLTFYNALSSQINKKAYRDEIINNYLQIVKDFRKIRVSDKEYKAISKLPVREIGVYKSAGKLVVRIKKENKRK